MTTVVETIILNSRVKAKKQWDFGVCARNHHAHSFNAPNMLKHLMIMGRVRMYPYSDSQVAIQVYDDSNPYQLAITRSIIKDEIARMTRLDELNAAHYG